MFSWFRRKEETSLQFPDNESAFAHACTIHYPLLIDARIPALVMEEGQRGRDGEHCFCLHLAGPNGVLTCWGSTLAGAPAYPAVGDFVAFRIVRIATDLPVDASLFGYIAGGLDPVLLGKKGWRVNTSFTPANLKPELHL